MVLHWGRCGRVGRCQEKEGVLRDSLFLITPRQGQQADKTAAVRYDAIQQSVKRETSVSRKSKPLILITNDDGIHSPGLLSAVEAVHDLGDILVVAPKHQQTGAGRSTFSVSNVPVQEEHIAVGGQRVSAFSVEGTPAQAVLYALVEVTPGKPSLAISGINYGENLGTSVTGSGTVGAALEAAVFGIPSLAVSLETAKEYHYSLSHDMDFAAAAFFTRIFAQRLLSARLLPDVDVLKIDVPEDATEQTPWRLTRVSRQRYFHPIESGRARSSGASTIDYEVRVDFDALEPDSDIFALVKDRAVSVSPLSLDLSSRVDLGHLAQLLRSG
jgi:5'-nucleotidase